MSLLFETSTWIKGATAHAFAICPLDLPKWAVLATPYRIDDNPIVTTWDSRSGGRSNDVEEFRRGGIV